MSSASPRKDHAVHFLSPIGSRLPGPAPLISREEVHEAMVMIPLTPSIALPRVDTASLVALAVALETELRIAKATQARSSEAVAANARGRRKGEPEGESAVPVPIAAGVTSCMKRLGVACTQLSRARRAASRSEGRPQRAVRKGLLGRYRKAWSMLASQVEVWRGAGALASLTEAQRASLDRVVGEIPDLRTNARAAWTLGRDALEHIRSEGVDAVVAALGGAAVLAHVERVHGEMGAAFGVTASTAVDASGGAVADAMASVQSLMREYVLKVHAMVDPEVPGSDELAAQLLAPFVDVRSAARPAPGAKAKAPVTPADPARPDAQPAAPAAPALRPTG